MTAPGNATLTFDQPDGGYTVGAMITATVTATSENTTSSDRTVTATITDPATGEESTASGSFTVNEPNPLSAVISETDVPTVWTPQSAQQVLAAFTATFTATAA